MPSISKASLMEPAKRDAEKCILPHPFVEEAYLCHQQCRNWLHSLFLTCFSPSALPAEENKEGFIRLTELCYKPSCHQGGNRNIYKLQYGSTCSPLQTANTSPFSISVSIVLQASV